MKIRQRIEKTILSFDRSSLHAKLNDPIWFQLKKIPANPVFRVFKGLALSLLRIGYEVSVNERIVEIPFVFQNLSIVQKGHILDFGCCESKVAIELASLGYEVTGADMNDYPFTHPNFRFIKGNFLESSIPDDFFDGIVAISAVEHCGLPDAYGSEEFSDGDKKVVREFHRILRRGGQLLITLPFGKRQTVLGSHGQRIYDQGTLNELLHMFYITKAEYFMGIDRKNWMPVAAETLSDVESGSENITKGVVCISARK